MIISSDFNSSINFLNRITTEKVDLNNLPFFSNEYKKQHPIISALKILQKASAQGTVEQKRELLNLRGRVVALNTMLSQKTFIDNVKSKMGISLANDPEKFEGIQISLPQTKFEKMVEIATKIPRIAFTLIIDLVLAPAALILVLIACCKPDFNPSNKDVKKNKIPILLLHGSGFNETEWIVGRQFLKKQKYGSVFSLNYDGLVSNDPKKGIEDYAKINISAEIKRIKELTGSDQVILIGHSMGGLIAGYYAEHCAQSDGVKVENVISIASPWQGTPMIDSTWKLGGRFSKENETKRHQQMSIAGGTKDHPEFRKNLVAKALDSERQGMRKYFNIWSSTDYAVPCESGSLTEDPRRQRSFNYLGHYGIIVWPSVWLQVRSWLDKIYA